jgi:hypothetical protein
MIKDVIIVVLVVLLVLTSYLLFDSRKKVFNGRSEKDQQNRVEPEKSNDIYKTETLNPKPTPEIYKDPTIGLNLDTTKGKGEAETGVIVFRYGVIHPTVLKVTDSEGNTVAEVNLETGETVFTSKYTPDKVSIEFWKSIAKNYPEICTVKENPN